jgi:PA14 domain
MNKILLPSGGTINVDFESDDYAYVQNKKASSMYSILGFGSSKSPTTAQQANNLLYALGVEYDHIYINLSKPITTTNAIEQQKELQERFFENTKQLYMKLAVVMPSTPGIAGTEYIPVYADIKSFGIVPNTSGTVAYVEVERVANKNTPMVQQALQFLKQQLPGKAYKGYDMSESGGIKAVITALSGMGDAMKALKIGDDNVLKRNNKCKEILLAKSFVRLTNPFGKKMGGGLRVKRVKISDSWNKMTNQLAATYGQEYKYTTTTLVNGKKEEISSGVAAWEPSIGSDENPFKEIMRFFDNNKKGPFNYGAVEMPLGEAFYPSPTVGYSKVEVLSIHRDTVKNLPTRQVTEFYTTKDFPYKSSSTQLSDPTANVKYEPKAILQLLKINMKKAVTQSQGFLVEMNDMNGKVKIQSIYSAIDSINPISSTYNHYNIEKATDNTFKFNHQLPVIKNAEGVISSSIIGRDIELMADFREHKSETITTNISINFDFFTIGGLPIPLNNLLQPVVYEGTTYRSAALLKLVNHYGVLDSVVVINKGSMVSTKNLVYDAETGNPLLTRTNNEHNKPIYNFSYPAHWAYSGMAGAYKNIDANYNGVTFRHGKLEGGVPMNIFESGDEIYVIAKNNKKPLAVLPCDANAGTDPWTTLNKNEANRIWAINTAKVGSATPQFVFVDKDGNPYNANGDNLTMRIVRSGHRNLLDQAVGSITTLKYPVVNNKLTFNDETKVLQTSAATFKDHWRVDNSLFIKDSLITTEVNSYLRKIIVPIQSNVTVEKERKPNGDIRTFNVFNSPSSIVSKRWDLGRNHSDYGASSWMKFNFTTLPNDLNIVYAKLSLFGHWKDGKNPNTNENHPNQHSDAFPHSNPGGNVANILNVSRLKINWPSTNQDWKNVFNNDAFYHDPAATTIVNQTAVGNSNFDYTLKYNQNQVIDDRIDVLNIAKKIYNDRNNPQTSNANGIRVRIQTNGVTKNMLDPMQCFWAEDKYGMQSKPIISLYYTDCTNTTAPSCISYCDPLMQIPIKCIQQQHVTACFSKFSRKAINPYVEGIWGNWRVDSTYAYYSSRNETDPLINVDTRKGGTINNYKSFWNLSPNNTVNNLITRNYSASDVWVWNSTITQYNRKGYEIENKDPLNRFNAGLYGYNQQLPIAVANNSRVREVMYDGFEDYDYQTALNCVECKPRRHFNYTSNISTNIDATQKHTGQYSLKINPASSVIFQAPITNTEEADKPYAMRVKMDSTFYNGTIVTPNGSGFRGKYYNYITSLSCSLIPKFCAEAKLNSTATPDFTRQGDNLNYNFNVAGLPSGIGPNNFTVRWEGYLQPTLTGLHAFKLYSDDGHKITITNQSGSVELYNSSNSQWKNGTNQTNISPGIQLTAGGLYKIKVDYYQVSGPRPLVLTWKTPNNNSFETIPNVLVYSPDNLAAANGTVQTGSGWCTRLDSVNVRGNALTDTFSLIQNKQMLLSAWVKEGGNDCKCSTYIKNKIVVSYTGSSQTQTMQPTGSIIEGWQRYEAVFTVPQSATAINVSLQNNNTASGANVYFDDLRIHPYQANVKSFVYNASSLRLMAELDENNYASYYEYDDDGTLTRVKKETEKGVKTITETRSAMQKTVQE